ncbi:putative serine/threonine-protein kinase [Aphelenchoides besseyi]|nr:putative serine/threonine-protein kinase [Aphelenchoides besseyi]
MPSALNANKETQEDDTRLGPEKKTFRSGQTITRLVEIKTVRYVLQRKIGESKNGAVFEALNDRKELFALKFEWRGSEKVDPRLGMEIAILRHVRQNTVSPHFVDFFMVTTLLAENLQRKLDATKGRMFSKHTAVGVGLQVLDALRELHSLGYVHRDIRPHNLNPGLDEKSHVIFLMNFGQAAVYRKGNKTRKPRAHVPMKGHPLYCSLSAHLSKEQSPKDDVESLLMTIGAMANGLPWTDQMAVEAIGSTKGKLRNDESIYGALFHGMNPKVFRDLLVMLDNKSYYDTVDYDAIKNTITAAAASAGVTNLNLNFDWEPKSASQSSRSLRDLKKATEEESDSASSRVESKMKFD